MAGSGWRYHNSAAMEEEEKEENAQPINTRRWDDTPGNVGMLLVHLPPTISSRVITTASPHADIASGRRCSSKGGKNSHRRPSWRGLPALTAALLAVVCLSPAAVSAALMSDTSWAADCQKFSFSDKIEVGWEDAGNLVELHIRHNTQVGLTETWPLLLALKRI